MQWPELDCLNAARKDRWQKREGLALGKKGGVGVRKDEGTFRG